MRIALFHSFETAINYQRYVLSVKKKNTTAIEIERQIENL